MKFRIQEPMQGISMATNLADVEAEIEDGKTVQFFMDLPDEKLAPLGK